MWGTRPPHKRVANAVPALMFFQVLSAELYPCAGDVTVSNNKIRFYLSQI